MTYIVREDSPAAVATAIVKVVKTEELAARLIRGALQEARSGEAKCHALPRQDRIESAANTQIRREGSALLFG